MLGIIWSIWCGPRRVGVCFSLIVSLSLPTALLAQGDLTPSQPGAGQPERNNPTRLRVQWEPGQRYLYDLELEQVTQSRLSGSTQTVRQTVAQTQQYAVTAHQRRDQGGFFLSLEITEFQLEGRVGEELVLSFDSSSDKKDEPSTAESRVFQRFLGRPIEILTDPDGRIQSLPNLPDLLEELEQDASRKAKPFFQGILNEENLSQLTSMAEALPERPLRPGDRWPFQIEMPIGPGNIVVKMEYIFRDWEERAGHPCARLEHTGQLVSSGPENAVEQPFQIENGVTSGTTWFAADLGKAIESRSSQRMTILLMVDGRQIRSDISQSVRKTFLGQEPVTEK